MTNELKALMNQPVSKSMIEWLVGAKRADETTVDKIQSATRQDRNAIIQSFKAFEKAGLGEFIAGRHGHKSRFSWLADHTQLLAEQKAIAGLAELSQAQSTAAPTVESIPATIPHASSGDLIALTEATTKSVVEISSPIEISIVLPKAMTPQAAKSFASMLLNLAKEEVRFHLSSAA